MKIITKPKITVLAVLITLLPSTKLLAAKDNDIQTLRLEIQNLKQTYESRISELENKLAEIKNNNQNTQVVNNQTSSAQATPQTINNSFNPAIGLILNGKYSSFSEKNSDIKGFATPGEGTRSEEGFKLGESELNMSANIDDKFRGSLTTSFVNEDGEDKLEIEESFIQTLPGIGLPTGMNVKAGRALWTLGYLNEQHAHTDDFADRPLPYRVFLNNAYNDDGIELSYVLPTDFYSEIGGGLFRGDDYPFGSASGSNKGAFSAFARIGGDITNNQTFRIGTYVLSGNANSRNSNEDNVNFSGDNNLYISDLRYTWAPTGNEYEKELLVQGEYFYRQENGIYEDLDTGTGAINFNDPANGWYAQTVYKFKPQWRVGYRYSRLDSPNTPSGLEDSILDAKGHNPDAHALMIDFSNSEFSRLRLQYNHENPSMGQSDNQIMLQYIMSLGAHKAHKY